MANSGYKDYAKLEMYYVGDGVSTGKTKNNVYGQPDYVSTVWDIEACPLPDTTNPNPPTSLWWIGSSLTSISFEWSGATDNIGVVSYNVLVIGVGSFDTTSEYITIEGLTAGTIYEVHVFALDLAGNMSAGITNSFGTSEDLNTSIYFDPYNLVYASNADYQSVTINSNYDELNFSTSESWLTLDPSGFSNNLMLGIAVSTNFDYYSRYASVYVYHGSTYLGSITVEQTA